jgi:hypothetical protein
MFVFFDIDECLLRGTNRVFNSDGYSFVLKGLELLTKHYFKDEISRK